MIDTVAVLAGGLATRMRPLTERIPKALLDVGGEPFVHHQLRLFATKGLQRVVMLTGYLGDMIESSVGDGRKFGLAVEYSPDGETLVGTGGAVFGALDRLPDKFFVTYGDSYLDTDYSALSEAFDMGSFGALMSLYRNEGRYDRSNADLRDGRAFYSKSGALPEWRYIDYGLLVLTRSAVAGIKSLPCDLSTLLSELSLAGRLQGEEVRERFYEIGSPEGYAETIKHLSGGRK